LVDAEEGRLSGYRLRKVERGTSEGPFWGGCESFLITWLRSEPCFSSCGILWSAQSWHLGQCSSVHAGWEAALWQRWLQILQIGQCTVGHISALKDLSFHILFLCSPFWRWEVGIGLSSELYICIKVVLLML
jgi:hypothetical protein